MDNPIVQIIALTAFALLVFGMIYFLVKFVAPGYVSLAYKGKPDWRNLLDSIIELFKLLIP